MVHDARLVEIVDALLNLTTARRLDWDSIGSARAEKYATSLSSTSFVVYSKDNDGQHPFVVELRNANGDLVESIRSRPVRPRMRRVRDESETEDPAVVARRKDDESFNKKIQELYSRARRNAMNVDSFIDEVLEQLRAQGIDSDEA
ncbi:hypothetical protein KYY02_14935 [Streptomyces pimonensis]|uniref:Uncharacterized protein n=1 Tax=Streptomyces pimonensis TaxID=2860288 RepID=A0ABV4IZ24_9ACTN